MKETYRSMNEKIVPTDDLKEKVFSQLEKPKRQIKFRPFTAVAAVLAVLLLVNPITASGAMTLIAELMYLVSPEMAARFTPVQEADEKNGIRMEVISTSIHGATTEICVSFEDLEEDRIDENIIMAHGNFYSGSRKVLYGGYGGGVDAMDYDEETGKFTIVEYATHSFYSEEEDRYLSIKENYREKITYCVDYLLKKIDLPEVELPIAMTGNEIQLVDPRDNPYESFGGTGDKEWVDQKSYKLLKPGDPVQKIGERVELIGMDYVDGEFHVLVRSLEMDSDNAPGCEVYLVNADGDLDYSNRSVDYRSKSGYTFREFVFDVPETEIDNYTLMCSLCRYEYIRGPWKVTFPITESDYVGEHDDGVPLVTASEEIGTRVD